MKTTDDLVFFTRLFTVSWLLKDLFPDRTMPREPVIPRTREELHDIIDKYLDGLPRV